MATSTLPELREPVPVRRRVWQSPVGQPAWARPALLAIAALAGLLYLWGADQDGYHSFYANAVRSMTVSWKAFLFGSYDPANTITLDKLPGFLWPQALLARLLGFHGWALALPQAVEGVLSVLVLFRTVRLWAGAGAALLAAALFTLTPELVGLFRTPVEEPVFTLLLLLAAESAQRAVRTAGLRALLLAGVWVGLAFQAKMLEAWAVLPVFAGVYLLAAPTRLRRRLAQLALAGLVTVAVSAAWMALVTLTPVADRPYVDGTTDNSAYSMVVGYNFLNRFSAVGLTAERTGSVTVDRSRTTAMPAQDGGPQLNPTDGRTGTAGPPPGDQGDGGWAKLLRSRFASQVGWLYPLAAISLLHALLRRRRAPRTDPLRAGYLLWGGWATVFFLSLSAGSIGMHTYYLGSLAVALAALGGAGTVLLWRDFGEGGPRALALPAAVAASVLWSGWLSWRLPTFLPWLAPTAVTTAALALALLGTAKSRWFAGLGAGRARIATAGIVAGLVAALLAPTAWAASVLDPKYGSDLRGAVGPMAAHRAAAQPVSTRLTPQEQELFAYVQAHNGGARYLLAAYPWQASSPYILATAARVLPMGGFTGQVPSPTAEQLRELVADGRLRHVLIGREPSGGVMRGTTDWVRAHCTQVPPGDYGQPTATAQVLYRCGQQAI
ncbi:glycosyltransferase family 39 protein [Kitasatospora sp. NBC_01250]|uniref:ArnT family glycosyltransferase n=1 Tax=Kitasatospora sp. NBC_01250 TaxID=2903571 RepID=UPI002E32D2B9|nr:glycosyltransferase family 39 protein [Kitasatospora sp. NBC_01250]